MVLFFGMSSVQDVSASELPPTKTVNSLGPLQVQTEFPTFGGFDLEGNYVSLQTLLAKEHIIVISYFATWCEPCRIGMPIIEKVVSEQPKVSSIFIGLGERSSLPVELLLKELNIDGVVLLDKFKKMGERHGVVLNKGEVILPRTFIVSKTGILETIVTTEGSDFEEILRKEIVRIEGLNPNEKRDSDE